MSTSSDAPREVLTPRLRLVLASPELAPLLSDYYRRNRDFLFRLSPARPDSFYTVEGQRIQLEKEADALANDRGYRYYLFKRNTDAPLIGFVGANEVIRGSFQSAFVSYSLDKGHLRYGYMTEALTTLVDIAFGSLALHRLEANIMPRNIPSLRTAAKCGFRPEGIAEKYLRINGVWEDHIHMVRRNPAME